MTGPDTNRERNEQIKGLQKKKFCNLRKPTNNTFITLEKQHLKLLNMYLNYGQRDILERQDGSVVHHLGLFVMHCLSDNGCGELQK